MTNVVNQAGSFLVIIALGFILKRTSILDRKDSRFLSKIIMNVTLPSALISNITDFKLSYVLIIVFFISVISNITMAILSNRVFTKENPISKSSLLINSSGYNVANITLPFVIAFFPPSALVYLTIFDMGNVFAWMGGVFSFAKITALKDNFDLRLKDVLIQVFTIVPLLTYFFIIFKSLIGFELPDILLNTFRIVGSSNTFLIMLLIGLLLEFDIERNQILNVVKVIFLRLFGFAVIAIFVWISPLSLLARQVIVLALAAPVPSIAVVFCKTINDDSSIPSMISSFTMVISLTITSILIILFNL